MSATITNQTLARRRLVVGLALGLSLAMSPLVTGCGGDDSPDSVVDGSRVDVDTDTSSGDLPDDFPTDVAEVDAPIDSASVIGEGDERVWMVAFRFDSLDQVDQVYADLDDAGYTRTVAVPSKDGQAATYSYSNDARSIVITVAEEGDDGVEVAYTVGKF